MNLLIVNFVLIRMICQQKNIFCKNNGTKLMFILSYSRCTFLD